ncbi:MAG: hypothetical protein ACEPO2_17375 [Pelagibaca sp.]
MTQNNEDSGAKTMARPIALVAVIAAIVAFVVWQFGPTAYSTTNPYLDDLTQNPTGAGSNPDNIGTVLEDEPNVPVERTPSDIIDGNADATDLTGITDPVQDNTVADEGRRLLDADAVVSPENGTVNNETGMVETTEDSQ